jgi:hypothetical protein
MPNIIEGVKSDSVRKGALTSLKGDMSPVISLLRNLERQMLHVEFFPDQLSPVSGEGRQCATADLRPGSLFVYFPSDSNAHGIFHELLHAKLSVLNGVEALVAGASHSLQDKEHIGWFNNDLEHVHVIPEEIRIYPEALKYWEGEFRGLISGDAWLPSEDGDVLRQRHVNLLRGWLILPHLAPSSHVTAEYRQHLHDHGWLEGADTMHADVIRARFNKRHAATALFHALQYEKGVYCDYKRHFSPFG